MKKENCQHCDGRGRVSEDVRGTDRVKFGDCHRCNGTGKCEPSIQPRVDPDGLIRFVAG